MSEGFETLAPKDDLAPMPSASAGIADSGSTGGGTRVSADMNRPDGPGEVTPHQERIWLAQQQQPDRVLRHASAFRLAGRLDRARLVRAMEAVTRAWPDLTARYRFSDEGELARIRTPGGESVVEIVALDAASDLVSVILADQAQPWDSEEEPPFKALLILCGEDTYLVLILHRILEESAGPEEVLACLARAYAQEDVIPPVPRVVEPFGPMRKEAAPVGWLRRPASPGGIPVMDFLDGSQDGAADSGLAHRWGAVLAPGILRVEGHETPDVRTVLARAGSAFAQLLCRLGGHDRIDAEFSFAAEDKGQDDTASGRQTVRVPILRATDADKAARDAEIRLRNSGETSPEQPISTDAAPRIAIRWLSDPNRFFDIEGVTVERIPLPTRELRDDFELGVGLDDEGGVVLELLTGQKVRAHAGALLLDILADDLAGGAERSLDPSPVQAPQAVLSAPPDPGASAGAEPGQKAIEAAILSEFREALSAPELRAEDDFFDFGGHSLVATRIIGRLLHNHGIEVRFNDLFGNPTAASLALHARIVSDVETPGGEGSVEVRTGNVEDAVAPLAFAQMSLWKIYSVFGFSEMFNLPFALDFLDEVDETVFGAAFSDLMKRHASLRTLYVEGEEGAVLQKVVPAAELGAYTWFWRSEDSADTDRHAEAGYRFDLSRELPVRLRFFKDAETGRQVLSFLFHHLALDEWSVNLMMDELREAYDARARGAAPVWEGEPAPFHALARKQVRAGVNGEHLAYWTAMLEDAPRSLDLFEATEPTPDGDDGAAGGWIEMRLEKDVSEGLYALARERSASLFNVAYGAISAALQRLGGLTDLVIGTSASGRTDPDYFDTIGYFTTVVAHRVRFAGDPTVGELVSDIKHLINGSMPYTDIPIDLVEAALGIEPGRDHLFDVFIQIHAQNKLNGNLTTPDGRPIAFRQVDPDKHESHLALQFEVMEEVIDGDRSIRVLMSYQARRYTPDQVATISETVTDVFRRFAGEGAAEVKLSSLGS